MSPDRNSGGRQEAHPVPEQDIHQLYTRLRVFVQENTVTPDPNESTTGFIQRVLFQSGFTFIHSKRADPDREKYDLYRSSNLNTIRIDPEGQPHHLSLLISVRVPCSRSEEHEPSEIPQGTPINLSLPGLSEQFIIDGTLAGTGLGSLGNPNPQEITTPLTRSKFEEFQSYAEGAHFGRPPTIEFMPG